MLIAPLAVILVLPVAAIYPGWKREKSLRPTGIGPLMLPFSALALWIAVSFAMALLNVKDGSLSNLLVEGAIVAWAAVAIAYAGFLVLGPRSRFQARRGTVTYASLFVAVVLVRILVPELGE